MLVNVNICTKKKRLNISLNSQVIKNFFCESWMSCSYYLWQNQQVLGDTDQTASKGALLRVVTVVPSKKTTSHASIFLTFQKLTWLHNANKKKWENMNTWQSGWMVWWMDGWMDGWMWSWNQYISGRHLFDVYTNEVECMHVYIATWHVCRYIIRRYTCLSVECVDIFLLRGSAFPGRVKWNFHLIITVA